MKKPSLVEMDLSEAMIEEVFQEFEREHPGQDIRKVVTPEQFSKRLMEKIMGTAHKVEGGNA